MPQDLTNPIRINGSPLNVIDGQIGDIARDIVNGVVYVCQAPGGAANWVALSTGTSGALPTVRVDANSVSIPSGGATINWTTAGWASVFTTPYSIDGGGHLSLPAGIHEIEVDAIGDATDAGYLFVQVGDTGVNQGSTSTQVLPGEPGYTAKPRLSMTVNVAPVDSPMALPIYIEHASAGASNVVVDLRLTQTA